MYKKLRLIMFENDITIQELAKRIGVSNTYMSNRLNGKHPFSMDNVYAICKLFSIPYEEISTYFPERRKTNAQAV